MSKPPLEELGEGDPSSPLSQDDGELPPATSDHAASKIYPGWRSQDPRSSSALSLVPSRAGDEQRRTLLMVYIHGFMGNDSSFRSFPAHVHNYLKESLADTHAVHTKIYPRYKTYKAIDVARDNFSKWLEPHESPTTDVVLVGHSMGGLLAADIALLQLPDSFTFQHRILGTLSLDSPFLGLHPGIIVSGIASLFRPAQEQPAEPISPATSPASPRPTMESLSRETSIFSEPSSDQLSSLTLSSESSQRPEPSAYDPSFNPPFFNDVMFRDRGWFKNVVHFANKHRSENLVEAARDHILSHLEFGGCLADYAALNHRYRWLRRQEDVNELTADPSDPRKTARVRFANYYTLSTGREKKPKAVELEQDPEKAPEVETELAKSTPTSELVVPSPRAGSLDIDSHISTPRISIEDHSGDEVLQVLEPMPEEEDEQPPSYEGGNVDTTNAAGNTDDDKAVDTAGTAETKAPAESTEPAETPDAASSSKTVENSEPAETPDAATQDDSTQADLPDTAGPSASLPEGLQLPAIPDLPEPPTAPDLTQYTDKEVRKQVEKEAKRAQKTYEQAVKSRDKALKERQKLIEKHERKTLKDAEKREKELQKEARRREKEAQKEAEAEERAWRKEQQQQEKQQRAEEAAAAAGEKAKNKKARKFCMLPKEVSTGRDPTWVPVHMVGMDEVGAHCGLFLPGPHYDVLVGDVGERVVAWVREDASRRAILELRDAVD